MKAILLLALLAASPARADSLYTCANNKGDTVMIEFSRGGQRLNLRSRYAQLKLSQSKAYAGINPGYTYFQGKYPSGGGYEDAMIAVQSRLVRGYVNPKGSSGSITLASEDYECKAGAGKLKVSRETRDELNPPAQKEPCKLTSYYEGMTFMPPIFLCDYGFGPVIMRTGGAL